MKHNSKIILAVVTCLITFGACKKIANTYYPNGNPVTLTASTTTVSPSLADSSSTALTLNWSSPKYSTDSSHQKFIIELDSSGRNFSHEATFVINGSLSTSLTAEQINNIALSWGFAFNQTYPIDIRVTSSYLNNNEQYKSNIVTIKYTPYVVPPLVTPPSSKMLFITGSATAGSWQGGNGSGVPTPAQQFTMLDSVTYQGTFFLNGGQQYLLLPVNGDWTNKYSVADNNVPGLSSGGSFGYDLSSNFPAPPATGMYTITVDFQHGIFSVVPVGVWGLLYVPGDYQGWTPASAPALGSPKNDGNYDGYINIPTGGTYQFKFTPTSAGFNDALGDGGNGTLSTSGGNLTVPAGGYYHIVANTTALTWSATATTWSIIGSFAASNWSNDIDMVFNSSSNTWSGTITTVAGDQFKFRANHDWGLNYGENGTTGSLKVNGDNIGDPTKNFAVPAGTHKITLFLNNSGYYTCLIQ